FSFSNKPEFGKYGIAVGILILIFFLFLAFRKSLKGFSIYQKIEIFIKGIWEGFKSILHLKERFLFVLYSFGIWISYFLMTYLVIFAFPETSDFGMGEGFFLIVSGALGMILDRKSTRLNSSHVKISYAVFCLKKKMHKLENSAR